MPIYYMLLQYRGFYKSMLIRAITADELPGHTMERAITAFIDYIHSRDRTRDISRLSVTVQEMYLLQQKLDNNNNVIIL